MKLSEQVCSIERAKHLKELGVKQESHFYWCRLGGIDRITENTMLKETVHEKHWHSAFTVGEMLNLVPSNLYSPELTEHQLHQLLLEKQGTQYRAMYVCRDCQGKLIHHDHQLAVEALAEIAINLITHKLWDPSKPPRSLDKLPLGYQIGERE